MRPSDEDFLREAIRLAEEHAQWREGGPFGAIIVREQQVIGRGWNQVIATNDPTAHAEVIALRAACRAVGDFRLNGCVLYASCEPCPMCLAAAYWARVQRIVFAATREDAAAVGFDDAAFYGELSRTLDQRTLRMTQHLRDDAVAMMQRWHVMPNRPRY